jgi:hypothetical protein
MALRTFIFNFVIQCGSVFKMGPGALKRGGVRDLFWNAIRPVRVPTTFHLKAARSAFNSVSRFFSVGSRKVLEICSRNNFR